MNNKFLSNIYLIRLMIVIVLLFVLISCNSSKKEEKDCAYNNIRNCEDFISKIIYDKGSVMPPDGIVPLKDWTFFLTYFDSNTSQITEKYIKMDCNCDLIYFGDENPIIKNSIY
tara:strand:- start:3743 stop:4084 length:342 start_codon:yes stop_codon:yes gene_type:complete